MGPSETFFLYLLVIGLHHEYILYRKYGMSAPTTFALDFFDSTKYNIYTGKTK